MRPFFYEFGMSFECELTFKKIIVLAHVSSRCAQSRALDTEPIFHGAFEGKSWSPGLPGVDRGTVCRDDSGASVLGVQVGR
ncbi:hypothetical protein ABIC49_001816 [Burkholderia ambifaria]